MEAMFATNLPLLKFVVAARHGYSRASVRQLPRAATEAAVVFGAAVPSRGPALVALNGIEPSGLVDSSLLSMVLMSCSKVATMPTNISTVQLPDQSSSDWSGNVATRFIQPRRRILTVRTSTMLGHRKTLKSNKRCF